LVSLFTHKALGGADHLKYMLDKDELRFTPSEILEKQVKPAYADDDSYLLSVEDVDAVSKSMDIPGLSTDAKRAIHQIAASRKEAASLKEKT